MPQSEVDAVAKLRDAEFVAFFDGLSFQEVDAWTEKLFRSRRTDEEREPINAKYRALIDHRVKQLRVQAPEMFMLRHPVTHPHRRWG